MISLHTGSIPLSPDAFHSLSLGFFSFFSSLLLFFFLFAIYERNLHTLLRGFFDNYSLLADAIRRE